MILKQDEIVGAVEAMLFVLGEPILPTELAKALDLLEADIQDALRCLMDRYAKEKSGLMLRQINHAVQLCSNPRYASAIERLLIAPKNKNLSNSLLETLSIVAYKQPITRSEIEEIRGVRCEYAINQLLEQALIIELAKKKTIGRPSLFGTTDRFLQIFGIRSLDELPPLKDEKEEMEPFGVV